LADGLHGVVAPLVSSAPLVRGGPPAVRSHPAVAATRASLGVASPVVMSVARLVPIKGLDLLVRACARRAGDVAALPLVVVGDGPERERLRDLARGLGVPLRLVGAVPRNDVAAWLSLATVYAQPSRTLANGRAEGLPLATLEALSCGLPAVVSDSGGLAELGARHPAAVRVVPAGDVTSLATALRAEVLKTGVGVNVL
ncbi:MAG TPA: glycosyltransferase, partial [Polyangia bacterium]|nr:glycosyltransferase [Polyangia bacterium]